MEIAFIDDKTMETDVVGENVTTFNFFDRKAKEIHLN